MTDTLTIDTPTTMPVAHAKALYVETYGCQMNKADSELIVGLLLRDGYRLTDQVEQADVILVNT